jgi:hypothetical protein
MRRSRPSHDGKDDPRFDIVVTGDGFAERDMDRFLREANGLIEGLRGMRPFNALDGKINYHVLAAVSDQSGITDKQTYPEGPRKTYFHSMTEFENPTFRTAIGTPYPELVKTAVEAIRPWCEIDLVIVIANIDMYGGYAVRQHGTVFVSRKASQEMWVLVKLAAHESGHVIAKLADEYISGSAYDRSDPRPNVATDEQVASGNVPWRKFAKKKRAAYSNGKLRLVHRYDDAWNLAEQEPKLKERDMKRTGAFWGCMYTEPPALPSTRSVSMYDDERGAGYYRPSARCLMRKMDQEFCDVCADAITQAIVRKVRNHGSAPRARRPAGGGGYPPSKMPLAARPTQRD